MKIFIDTANLAEIKEACSWGIVDGVTTNPSLIKRALQNTKAKVDMEAHITKILEVVENTRPVSLEVIGTTEKEMLEQAEKLYEKFNPLMENVVIKIPVCSLEEISGTNKYDGLKVTKKLSEKGIPVNSTLIMSPEQALLAAKAGAKYVSPFAGRIDDFLDRDNTSRQKNDYYPRLGKKGKHDNGIKSGVDLIYNIIEILKTHQLTSEVIAASIRNLRQVREVALAGAHIATIPFPVLNAMIIHEKTCEGIKKFKEDVVEEYAALFR